MRTIYVGIIGFGVVGSGTAEVLFEQRERIEKRTGARIFFKSVLVRSKRQLPEQFKDVQVLTDEEAFFGDPQLDIIVELIGGIEPAKTYILRAIAGGKHVVTANKALLSECGVEIFAAAAKNNVEVGFEGSVAGGIPLIKTFKEGLAANRIVSFLGILNGTGNYILSEMTEKGLPFADVLQSAQEMGYAEADPTYDIEGIDTAHKLAILMTIAYGMKIDPTAISTEGITCIDPIDITLAREFGYRIKLLAISRNHGSDVEARVHPTLVPESHLLAAVNGPFNAVHIQGDMVGDILLYGPGAGKLATGSAVVSDLVDITRNILHGAENRVASLSYLPDHIKPRKITPLAELHCPFYFRFTTEDKPGVLSAISGILGEHGISIEAVIQKGHLDNGDTPIVIRTHTACEANVAVALSEIEALDMITAPTVKLRVFVA